MSTETSPAEHAHAPPADNSRFEPFNITMHPYKIVNGQEIDLHVILPKDIQDGKRPILIHLHGGFLVTGDALYPDWNPQWALNYQLLHSAIRISANYRLLPESNGAEIISDISDLLTWVETKLPSYLTSIGSSLIADLSKLLVYGESAGGYLAIQAGLMRPDLVKAVIAAYPITYIDSDWYSKASTDKSPFGAPQVPKSVVDDYIKSLTPGTSVSKATPPARLPVAISTLQNGMFGELLGKADELYLDRRVKMMGLGEKAPFLYIFHGKQDTAVPCEQSMKFVGEWKEKFGENSATGEFLDGEHGFDAEAKLEDEWMQRGLVGVTKAWIG